MMPGIHNIVEGAADELSPEDSRKTRLYELGSEMGLSVNRIPPPLPSPLFRPEPQSIRTEEDEAMAEDLLKRQQLIESHSPQKVRLSRVLPTKKKGWEYKEIYNALVTHVANKGSPGVAEALITKLTRVGGNLNLAQKSKTNLLTRKKSLDLSERSQVLQKAVENGHKEMVEVLLPFADALSLDTSLPIAFRNGDEALVELLISYGASAANTQDGQDAFRQACAAGGQANMVSMVMMSEGRPPVTWVSQAMVEAARVGCLETVSVLAQTTADGNHDNAAVLKAAVGLGRRDIALAVVLGHNPPRQAGLNEAFEQLMGHESINPNDKMSMAEVLLCAGAEGEAVSQALIRASASYFIEMVNLLVSHGASIEHENAVAVRKAISGGKLDLAETLLNSKMPFSSVHASECVGLLPKKMRFEERHSFLSLLLRRGASGPPLDDALIDAVEVGDVESARLLIMPQFPGGKLVGSKDIKKGPRSMVFESHAVASTDHKGGLALQIAVKNGSVPIVKLILVNSPSNDVMAQIFPSVRNLPRLDRFQMTEAFMGAGLSGPCVHSALQNAIDERPPHRDDQLIALLLRSNADVNFNEGAAITAAISQKDVSLLNRLLKHNPTPEMTAKAIPRAMSVDNPGKRRQMTTMLIKAGATPGSSEISQALATVLQDERVDMTLLEFLLDQGQADVNANQGVAIVYAVQNADAEVLETMLALGRPSPDSLELAIQCLSQVPSGPKKAIKLDSILRRSESKHGMSTVLVEEVQTVVRLRPEQRNFAVIKTLLENGADINAFNAEALCRAVAASSTQLVDLLFTAQPNPVSLSFAMPHALRVQDLMDRLTFAKKILQGGIPPSEVNRALVFAISTYPDDISLINTLLAHADTKDGLALMEAVKTERQDIVQLVLDRKKFTPEVLNTSFVQATRGRNRRQRSVSCNSLMKAGASGEVVSDALLAAAHDGDLELGTILVQNGGSVEHKDGQAIIEACRSGAVDILAMLLSGDTKVTPQTLERGFQAATEISDLKRRADIFKLILQRGLTGDIIDAELVSAERYGDSGAELVKLLLVYGASPDYNQGEAVEKAARSAFLGNLEMLLGIVNVGGKQKQPSSSTLVRAMDACWHLQKDTRFTVMEWILKAEKPVPSAVHAALTKAVNEEEPEERLIQLLMANRASPTANGCQTLIDATRTLSAEQFTQLLEAGISREEASFVFSRAFVPEKASSWLTERGLEIARSLLKKGATGEGVSSAFVAILGMYSQYPGQLADDFVELLLEHKADVNHNHGEALRMAAAQGHAQLLKRLLQEQPSVESLTLAFPRIFDAPVGEDEIAELITLFTEHGAGDGDVDNRMDVMFVYPGSEPVMIRGMSRFPRSTKMVEALLDAGYYHEQTTTCRVLEEVGQDEQVTLLCWAILQPQKKISSGVINLLIEKGAKVNFETRVSHVTPLMLAIQARRPDIVKSLLLAGAEVDVADATGKSPLSMASAIGGELAITIMSNLLAAGASRNDGSLHNAARELNLPAMQILVQYRHDADFPSPQHGGRSALGELCLHAADSGQITAMREKAMEKAINFLMPLSDITLQTDGKSVLLLALESADPVTTTKVLLRADMWKYINKPFNQYTDGKFTYSPKQYVSRVLPPTDTTTQLVTLLKSNRCADIYYASSGPQPDDAVGMPAHVELEEQERKARLARIAKENEDHARALKRNQELAELQAQIWSTQSELEEARNNRMHNADLSAIQERARVEEELFNQAMTQQRARQSQDLAHQQALMEASLVRAQKVGDAEMAFETQRLSRQLEWERELGSERVGNATQLSSIRLREREELERIDQAADSRFRERIREQKKLVDSQSHLAANLNQGPQGGTRRPQIGYVTGEVP